MTHEELKEKLLDMKQPIAFRINPRLIAAIDKIIPQTPFETRTAFVEEALAVFLVFIEGKLQS